MGKAEADGGQVVELEKFIKDKINEFTTKLEADPEFRLAVSAHLASVNYAGIVQEVCRKLIEEMAAKQAKTLDFDGKTRKALNAVSEKGRHEEGGIKAPASVVQKAGSP